LAALCFGNFSPLLYFILSIFFLWFFFLNINVGVNKNFVKNTKHVEVIKTNLNIVFIDFCFFLNFLNFFFIFLIKGKNSFILYNHISFNNGVISMLYLFIIISFISFYILCGFFKKNGSGRGVDYVFSICNLIVILPYLFFVHTVFTFLFMLELISTVIFYKLVSSKVWFRGVKNSYSLSNNIPQNYINMVFFQYWVTFLSTIFCVYFYINIFCIYGTSD